MNAAMNRHEPVFCLWPQALECDSQRRWTATIQLFQLAVVSIKVDILVSRFAL
ncbi:hypothetical protein B0J17DRAFT_652231, partial [Rhizoctonia solani]